MTRILFLDFREVETVAGLTRVLEPPRKHAGNPLFVADRPWENGNMQLYGSVIKAPGRPFQMWYSVIQEGWKMRLAYAESDDGLEWRRPELDIFAWDGRPTNIVFTDYPHGPAVIYDEREPREDRRYKLVAGSSKTDHVGYIHGFHSPDGIHWRPAKAGPMITTPPDCPMGFWRANDGRYVVLHRKQGFGRRVFRSESWDFDHFDEPRMILEPGPEDDPQTQFYGMGATTYGSYEIGTLWLYHTDASVLTTSKMAGYQEAELTYARHGHAWHRAAPRVDFIPHGGPEEWDRGNLQCASQPVLLDGEIRYYYMGTTAEHLSRWELTPQVAGLGMASMRPDRFVAMVAGEQPGKLLSVIFRLPGPELFVNADIAGRGEVRVELTDPTGVPIEGCALADCDPLTGDATDHRVTWRGQGSAGAAGQPVRVRLQAREARVYSIYATAPGETPHYRDFTAAWG